MFYEPIPELDASEIEQAIKRNDAKELSIAVLSAALYHKAEFAESTCQRLAGHSDCNVRGNAILGFSHVARLHGCLNKELVHPVVAAALGDEDDYVRMHAHDVKDDLEHWLRWKF